MNALNPELMHVVRQLLRNKEPEQVLLRLAGHYDRQAVVEALNQVAGEALAAKKFPFLTQYPNLRYPARHYLEQTSSQATADYKASLVSGDSLLDITGGFGIDFLRMANRFRQATYVERDDQLFPLVAHNLKVAAPQAHTVHGDGINHLASLAAPVDWLFVDPIRRDRQTRFRSLTDFSPDIVTHRERLLSSARNMLVKVSPMLDLQQLVRDLGKHVAAMHVVAVDNECKEVLLVMDGERHADPALHCVNLTKQQSQPWSSTLNALQAEVPVAAPLAYLYEPNAAIYKALAFDAVAHQVGLAKLHPNTHWYTADTVLPAFPGSIYRIMAVTKAQEKAIKAVVDSDHFLVKARNYPLKAEQAAAKVKVQFGGHHFLFFATLAGNEKRAIIAEKVVDYSE